jgi:LysM repeat protein
VSLNFATRTQSHKLAESSLREVLEASCLCGIFFKIFRLTHNQKPDNWLKKSKNSTSLQGKLAGMKKLILSFLFLMFAVHFVCAQKTDLLIRSSDKGLYLEHKVVPKESFYSVGRLYNVSPKSIASFNKLDMTKGLFIDQKIRIPLTDTNFIQQGNSGTPVYYKAKDKEDLAKVSADNNNVPVSNLKMWNDLNTDKVKEDAKLIVGFLVSKGMPSITINTKPVQADPVEKKIEKPIEKPVE